MDNWLPQGITELNLLDPLMKTSILKRVEAVIEHRIDLHNEDIIHLLQQVVTRDIPLYGGFLDESLRYDEGVVIREFPRSSPVKE